MSNPARFNMTRLRLDLAAMTVQRDVLAAALQAVVAVYDKVGGPLAVDPAVKAARAAIAKAGVK